MTADIKRTFSAKCIQEQRFAAALAAFHEEAEAQFGGPVRETQRVTSHHGNVTIWLAKAEAA